MRVISSIAVLAFIAAVSAAVIGAGYLYGHNYVTGKTAVGLLAAVAAAAYWVMKNQPAEQHWAGEWPVKTEQEEMNELLKGC